MVGYINVLSSVRRGGGSLYKVQRKSKVWMRKRWRKTKIRVFYLSFSLFFGQLVASRFIFRSSFILKDLV